VLQTHPVKLACSSHAVRAAALGGAGEDPKRTSNEAMAAQDGRGCIPFLRLRRQDLQDQPQLSAASLASPKCGSSTKMQMDTITDHTCCNLLLWSQTTSTLRRCHSTEQP
jgi:hypothetical protein